MNTGTIAIQEACALMILGMLVAAGAGVVVGWELRKWSVRRKTHQDKARFTRTLVFPSGAGLSEVVADFDSMTECIDSAKAWRERYKNVQIRIRDNVSGETYVSEV